MPRETDVLDPVLVLLLQQPDVEQADVLERHGVSRGAIVQHDAVRGVAAYLPELNDLLDLVLGGHACRNVDLPSIVVAKILHHVPMHVGRRSNLNQTWVQLYDLFCGGEVPGGARVLDADRLAVLLELAVVVEAQLEKLAVLPVGRAEGILRVRVGCVVLVRRQQLSGAPLLELAHCRARLLREREQLLRGLDLAPVVAADLGDDLGLPVGERAERGQVGGLGPLGRGLDHARVDHRLVRRSAAELGHGDAP
mmetsp:Transcript_31065/g.83167  ORF Transcript_31065/g.83167 Transcript_31065/m.83167 type:complete len:252 (+) Transcript_31065:654-1409(+)